MKNKKTFILLILVLVIILFALYIIIKNFNNETHNSEENNLYSDYTPEEEISSTQMRETIVTLFFVDTTTNNLKSEGRLIDSANLLQNPYKQLVELLLKGPETTSLSKVFPENTQILDATFESNCVTLNFSSELLNYTDDTQKYNIINSILNTLNQLN